MSDLEGVPEQPRMFFLSGVPIINTAYPERIMEKVFVSPEPFDAVDLVVDGIMDAISGKLLPGVTEDRLARYPGYEKHMNLE